MSRISKNTDLLQVLFEDLKMIKVKIIEKSDIKIKKILEQANSSIKKINNYIKNLEENLDIDETNLLKTVYELKNFKFVNFEDLENKYFYRVLEEEEDGVYKGVIEFGQNNALIKKGKGQKEYKDGRLFEGEWKNNKREGNGFERYADGDVYEGEFKNDKKEGKGIYVFASRAVYEGEFKNDKKKEMEVINL